MSWGPAQNLSSRAHRQGKGHLEKGRRALAAGGPASHPLRPGPVRPSTRTRYRHGHHLNFLDCVDQCGATAVGGGLAQPATMDGGDDALGHPPAEVAAGVVQDGRPAARHAEHRPGGLHLIDERRRGRGAPRGRLARRPRSLGGGDSLNGARILRLPKLGGSRAAPAANGGAPGACETSDRVDIARFGNVFVCNGRGRLVSALCVSVSGAV